MSAIMDSASPELAFFGQFFFFENFNVFPLRKYILFICFHLYLVHKILMIIIGKKAKKGCSPTKHTTQKS